MNTRLKIVGILFGIVYFYFVITAIINAIPEGISSFKEGYNSAKKFDEKSGNALNKLDHTETVFFHVKSASGIFSFPSSITNLKTGNPIRAEFQVLLAKVDTALLPLSLKIGYAILLLLVFPLLFAVLLFIPIQVYRVIRSMIKNEIFELRNIKRIRRIGYWLLFIFTVEMYASFIYYAEAQALVQLEDYRIVFKMGANYYWLLFASVTFMFAEILKISHTMKEEQDLTI